MSDHTVVVIWVIKTFFVQFFCVLLPPPLNIFCFCRSILFLSFIVPIFACNLPLVSLIFLKSSFPFCCFPLFLCIVRLRLSYLFLHGNTISLISPFLFLLHWNFSFYSFFFFYHFNILFYIAILKQIIQTQSSHTLILFLPVPILELPTY